MTDERLENFIAALLRERDGYEMRNDADGVAQVNAELAKVGAKTPAPAKRAAKRPAAAKATPKQDR